MIMIALWENTGSISSRLICYAWVDKEPCVDTVISLHENGKLTYYKVISKMKVATPSDESRYIVERLTKGVDAYMYWAQ